VLSQGKKMDQELHSRFFAEAGCGETESRLQGMHGFQAATERLLQIAIHNGNLVAILWIDLLNLHREFALSGCDGMEIMLRDAATTLREIVGPQAIMEHFHGRSFLIATLVSDCVEDGKRFAQLIADELAPPLHGSRKTPRIATGVAFSPTDSSSAEELLRFACLAACHAQQINSATVVSFQADMNRDLLREQEIEQELEMALSRNELSVAYQPKIDLIDGRILGAEALVRWQHSRLGQISPVDFIPTAERSGLIHPLFEFVLRTALEDTRRWNQSSPLLPIICVNTSVANLRQPEFPFLVKRCLEEIPIAPALLELEVTESLIFEDEEMFIERLQMLRQLGVRIAIDDFGTRYTGIDVLGRLPLDTMKIDKCFVQGIDHSPDLRVLCDTVVAMARQLKVRTIAEGIEEKGELKVMQQIGCDAGQGFLFEKALYADKFSAFLETWMNDSGNCGFTAMETTSLEVPLSF